MSGSMSPSKGQQASGKTGAKSGVSPVPEGYHTVTPYIMVDGGAKLIDFLKRAFDAKPGHVMDGPDGKIGHAEIRIGNSFIMLSDAMAEMKAMPVMNYLYVDDADATFKRAIQAGATQVSELKNQFYGDRAGCVKDPFGNSWWIATHIEDVSGDELLARSREQMKKMQKH